MNVENKEEERMQAQANNPTRIPFDDVSDERWALMREVTEWERDAELQEMVEEVRAAAEVTGYGMSAQKADQFVRHQLEVWLHEVWEEARPKLRQRLRLNRIGPLTKSSKRTREREARRRVTRERAR